MKPAHAHGPAALRNSVRQKQATYMSHYCLRGHGQAQVLHCVPISDKLATRRANLYLPDAVVVRRNTVRSRQVG